jgi:hypothetical protein
MHLKVILGSNYFRYGSMDCSNQELATQKTKSDTGYFNRKYIPRTRRSEAAEMLN